jgi:adenylate cyclase
VGLNSGDAVREGDDFFGLTVAMAARVTEKARGGQVLVTDLTRGLPGPWAEVRFVERGRHALNGFPGRHRLFEVHQQDDTY